jgi:hypothetical protein
MYYTVVKRDEKKCSAFIIRYLLARKINNKPLPVLNITVVVFIIFFNIVTFGSGVFNII